MMKFSNELMRKDSPSWQTFADDAVEGGREEQRFHVYMNTGRWKRDRNRRWPAVEYSGNMLLMETK